MRSSGNKAERMGHPESSPDSGGSSDGHWLSIGEACKYLGVDQSTLRRWSDSGRVPVFLTPGGHRRYAEEDLRSLVGGTPKKQSQRPRFSRKELTSRSLSGYADDYLREARERHWFEAFGTDQQEEHRRMGRQLVDLAIHYAATSGHQSDRARLLEEGREIGAYYGRSGAAAGLEASEAIEVFLYFRLPVVRAVLSMIEEEGLATRRAARLFVGIDDFIDQVLLAMIRAYEPARRSGRYGGNQASPDSR
jgi:excisionase family DNA binding protein